MGYDYILVYELVTESASEDLSHHTHYHEPFILLSHLAAVTQKIGLATGIMLLPSRQTVLGRPNKPPAFD